MVIFKTLGDKLSYKDILQCDGAFSVVHVNYDKSPIFNGTNSRNLAKNSRKNSLSFKENIKNVIECIDSFDGTEKNFNKADQISLWKNYWVEYINAFDKLQGLLPSSVVTIYIGRQAIEIGFKYLLLKKTRQIKNIKTHDLGALSKLFFKEYEINVSYMDWVDVFCEKFCKYIEGGNAEYFRYPEYNKNTYFAGNCLDIGWLSYNFALILLKLIHFADLDDEFSNGGTIKEENTMYKYKTEILTVGIKWFSDKANSDDIAKLDELLNQRASEGWELVTYDYMATSAQIKGAFVITFRK